MSKDIYPFTLRIKNSLVDVYHFLRMDSIMASLCVGNFKQEMDNAFSTYLNEEESCNNQIRKHIKDDMIDCYKKYLISPFEYFLYGFKDNKNEDYRASFLSDKYRTRILLKKGGRKLFYELSDKYYFYQKTAKYFKRNCILINSASDYNAFKELAKNVKDIFVKPISSTFGDGCCVYDVSDENKIEEAFNDIIKKEGSFLVENRILQSKEMNSWNESSCNTVRLPCFYDGKNVKVLQPFLRTGRKGDVVDNAGHGGMLALIDENSGILLTDAVDKYGNSYKKHPDSGIMYKGWRIPRWNELIETAENLFRECLPQHKYIGFDFALTDKGWVLIEGNWGQFVGQYNGLGVKESFLTYMGIK